MVSNTAHNPSLEVNVVQYSTAPSSGRNILCSNLHDLYSSNALSWVHMKSEHRGEIKHITDLHLSAMLQGASTGIIRLTSLWNDRWRDSRQFRSNMQKNIAPIFINGKTSTFHMNEDLVLP